jgi:tellurite resistance protein TehA-like permease
VLMFLNTAEGADVVHGGWLLAIVGTESLVVLGTVIAPRAGDFGPAMFVLAHMLWGVGLALYGVFITLFAYRIFYFDIEPDDIMPHLWVVMGAAAISTNAGSVLIDTDSGLPFLQAMRPFIDGTTLILWLDLDTGLGKFIVGQQLTLADAVVSITQDGFRRGAIRWRWRRGRWAARQCEPP